MACFLLCVVVQTSVLPAFGAERLVVLPVVAIVLNSIIQPGPINRWTALSAGFLFSIFADAAPGVLITVFTGVALLTETLFLRFFTNRSIYAVIVLMTIATVAHMLLLFLATLIVQGEILPSIVFQQWGQLVGNAVAAAVFFYTTVFSTRFAQRFFFRPSYWIR